MALTVLIVFVAIIGCWLLFLIVSRLLVPHLRWWRKYPECPILVRKPYAALHDLSQSVKSDGELHGELQKLIKELKRSFKIMRRGDSRYARIRLNEMLQVASLVLLVPGGHSETDMMLRRKAIKAVSQERLEFERRVC